MHRAQGTCGSSSSAPEYVSADLSGECSSSCGTNGVRRKMKAAQEPDRAAELSGSLRFAACRRVCLEEEVLEKINVFG